MPYTEEITFSNEDGFDNSLIIGRTCACDIYHPVTDELLIASDTVITESEANILNQVGFYEILVLLTPRQEAQRTIERMIYLSIGNLELKLETENHLRSRNIKTIETFSECLELFPEYREEYAIGMAKLITRLSDEMEYACRNESNTNR